MKIEEQVFQFPMTFNKGDDMILEFFVCGTNELNPYREIKRIGCGYLRKKTKKKESQMNIDS